MTVIVGRKHEVAILDEVYSTIRAQFLAVYGRRRIGKTFLVHHYFNDKGVYFELNGVSGATVKTQLTNFQNAFADTFYHSKLQELPDSWLGAMRQLKLEIEKIKDDKKVIIFLDEIPWLASAKSGFLEALDHFWNSFLSHRNNSILVICGSAAAWMIKNIIYDTGGLYGRLSREIQLQPYDLTETRKYLEQFHVELTPKQIVELFFATGGVAKYLNYIKPGLSSAQIINQVCFSKDGYLFTEFSKLYRSLFSNYENHIAIVRTLAQHPYGLARDQVLSKAGLSTGGSVTSNLEELCLSGFVLKAPIFNEKNKYLFRLIDPYSLFYLKWIEPARKITLENIDEDYWQKIYGTAQWYSWAGCSFENICLKHIHQIKVALGISGVHTESSTWRHVGDKSIGSKGAQIDLVIDRADQCINLCEIKFTDKEFVMTKEYAEKLNEKKAIFREATKTNKALFTTLITPYGAIENNYYHEAVQKQMTLDELYYE